MRTNSKIVRSAICQHILESVYDYDGNQFETFEQAAKHLYNDFDRVANYPVNIRRIPNNSMRFMDYMQGLPFNFYYSGGGISEFLDTLDLNGKGNYSSDKSEILYYYLVYSEMLKSVEKNK